MGNMSYCRFQNTLKDLQDCFDALQEENLEDLSNEELRSAQEMLQLCEQFVEEHCEKLNEYQEL